MERSRLPGAGTRDSPERSGIPRRGKMARAGIGTLLPRRHLQLRLVYRLRSRVCFLHHLPQTLRKMKTPQLPPFDHTPQPYTGPSADEVLALRKEFLSPAIFAYYKRPVMIVEGRGQY